MSEPLDNDLLDLWLRAGELDRDRVRELIQEVQDGRAERTDARDDLQDTIDEQTAKIEELETQADALAEERDALAAKLADVTEANNNAVRQVLALELQLAGL